MKKALSILLAICLFVCMVPLSASAEVVMYEHELSSDGTLTITGTGLPDFSLVDAYWYTPEWHNSDEVKKVVVESGVKSIGSNAFFGLSNLTSVVLPEGLVSIDESAFASCGSLQSITIPSTVEYIGSSAFWNCEKLATVNFSGSGNVRIGEGAFYGTPYYDSIQSQNGFKILKGTLIEYTGSDTNVTIPSGVESIVGAFYDNTTVESVTIPSGVKYIDSSAFSGCTSLTDVNIPTSVTDIGYYAFSDCTSLTGVDIPSSVTSIGDGAFSGCTSLTNVDIPSSVTIIGGHAFAATDYLTSITDGSGFSIVNDILVDYSGSGGAVTVPNTVKKISPYAFASGTIYDSGESTLTSITIPSSVTEIGYGAFYRCTSLKTVNIQGNLTEIASSTFEQCDALTSINIPSSVKEIGSTAFYGCTNLKSIALPSGIETIGSYAFDGCSALQTIDLPDTLKYIFASAFSDSGLTSVTIPDNVEIINERIFTDCSSLKSVTFGSGVKYISGQFAGGTVFGDTNALKDIKFTGNAPELGEKAFTGLTATVYYPEGNGTWTSSVRQNYGGTITWTSYSTGTGEGGGEGGTTNPPVVNPDPPADDPVNPDEPVEPDTPTEPTGFIDVPADAYYADAVAWAVENNITQGTSEDKFSPNASCTRAQAVTFLWRAAGSPVIEGETGFSDVPESAYYADAVKWAVANGITQGTGNGKFSPNETCDRAQIVTFMYRAEGEPAVEGSTGFGDVSSDDYYNNAVQWAVQNGVTQGTSTDTFSPDNDCVRAQIVTFLYRAYA